LVTIVSVITLERTAHSAIHAVLKWIPAILFAYIIPAIVTHLFGLDLSSVHLHEYSKDFIMPMAVIFVMSALSFGQLRAVGIRPIVVFLSGSAAVSLMPFLLLGFFSLFTPTFSAEIVDAEYWKGLVTLVGSWIGGSTSMLILKELSGANESIFLVILVMDNVLVNIWTILMFQKIKRSDSFNSFFKIKDTFQDFIPDDIDLKQNGSANAIITLGICLLSVLLCHYFISSFLFKIVVLSALGLILGNSLKFWNHGLMIKGGGFLIISIMAILGLKLNFSNFSIPISIVVFSIIWLISHYVIMMIVAYILRLNMAWVPIASMANVGGISTAPAVTKAYNEEWMPHAILLSILSMVTGTYWGMLTIYLFTLLAN
jgi:uncharacterized membrane protein